MKALSIIPSQKTILLTEREDPQIQGPYEVKVKTLEVGICGTDREEIMGTHAELPLGEKELIIGHEMMALVIETGSNVSTIKPGDLVVATVRRPCDHPECYSCKGGHPDTCSSGLYLERGIKGLHGFQAQFVVDHEMFFVKLPQSMRSYGVLCEPAAIVEKAIDSAIEIQSCRGLPDWDDPSTCLRGKKTLVAGLGSIGLLTAIILRLHGADVWGYDIVSQDALRIQLFKEIGGSYIDGKKITPSNIASHYESFDLIVEAVGVASVTINLISALGPNGICAMTGVTEANRMLEINVGSLIYNLVLNNQVIFGTVNAGKKHWKRAVRDLEKANTVFNRIAERLITHRFSPHEFQRAFFESSEDEIKKVFVWGE